MTSDVMEMVTLTALSVKPESRFYLDPHQELQGALQLVFPILLLLFVAQLLLLNIRIIYFISCYLSICCSPGDSPMGQVVTCFVEMLKLGMKLSLTVQVMEDSWWT